MDDRVRKAGEMEAADLKLRAWREERETLNARNGAVEQGPDGEKITRGPYPTAAIATGAADCADEGTGLRWWLERTRDQHRRDADAIQSLLDMLPAKVPPGAASALQRLLFK